MHICTELLAVVLVTLSAVVRGHHRRLWVADKGPENRRRMSVLYLSCMWLFIAIKIV